MNIIYLVIFYSVLFIVPMSVLIVKLYKQQKIVKLAIECGEKALKQLQGLQADNNRLTDLNKRLGEANTKLNHAKVQLEGTIKQFQNTVANLEEQIRDYKEDISRQNIRITEDSKLLAQAIKIMDKQKKAIKRLKARK
jgi:predicted  nucleic acid-binding Zn-ribbon protein